MVMNASLDPVLASLSSEDTKVLDDIIAKASDATAFTTVFKAYSEVLRGRGLDPGEDVVYYKQLLKLGVIKGVNWGAKWKMVKARLPVAVASAPPLSVNLPEKSLSSLSSIPLDSDDVFLSKNINDSTTFTKISSNNMSIFSPGTPERNTPKGYQTRHKITSGLGFSSSPSEGNRQSNSSNPHRSHPLRGLGYRSPTKHLTSSSKGVVNDNEAWKKIDETRLSQDADHYRRQSLLSTCFQTWRRGLEWVRVTHSQIDEARANIQLRIYLTRWRDVFLNIQRQAREAESMESKRTLYSSLHRWYQRLDKRRVRKFKEELDLKASNFQQRCQQRLCRNIWMKWYRLHLAEQFHLHHLLPRAFRRWCTALRSLDRLETLADQFEERHDRHTLQKLWDLWYRRSSLKDIEIYMTKRYCFRLLKESFEHLLHQMQEHRRTSNIYKRNLCKRFFKRWQEALSHREALVLRSDKYINRCNTVLLRAVMHVWVARERGQLLFRVRDARICQTALAMWQQQFQAIHVMQDRAVLFSQRISIQFVKTSFANWKQKLQIYDSQEALAKERYVCTLAYNVLLAWRLRLRERLSLFRTAKVARRYFLERSAWKKWQSALAAVRRKKKSRVVELEFIKKSFTKWKTIHQRCRQEKELLEAHTRSAQKHILNKYTEIWTNKTILFKLREMDIGDRYNKQLLSDVFSKWKEARSRNLENLSLVRSYLDVKREETLRRTFTSWLATTRKTKARRLRIAEQEEEVHLNILTMAWERWRDRFCENALREAELEVIIRNQRNISRHAFTSWLSHCDSIPGIRLYATNLKLKMWKKWREALPRAIQASKAEDIHARKLLRNIFNMWKEAHRTKIALKAVTRARHLRLPGPGYRASPLDERNSPAMKPSIRRPLRSQPPITPAEKVPVPSIFSGKEYKEKQFPSNTSPSRLPPINLTSRIAGPTSSEHPQPSTEREDARNNNENNARALLWTKLRNAQVARHMK